MECKKDQVKHCERHRYWNAKGRDTDIDNISLGVTTGPTTGSIRYWVVFTLNQVDLGGTSAFVESDPIKNLVRNSFPAHSK